MRSLQISFSLLIILFTGYACQNKTRKLPVLGEPVLREQIRNGIRVTDTVLPVIPDFRFMDQDSNVVTGHTFDNKVYVADFIFLSCPSICPKMAREMNKVYLHYAADDRVLLLSHTIDPERDSIPRLKAYARDLGVVSKKWHIVTGVRDSIFSLAERSYYANVYPDSTAPGGFAHSGGLLLVDKNKHIRGVYDGTDPRETERLTGDIQILLKEQFKY